MSVSITGGGGLKFEAEIGNEKLFTQAAETKKIVRGVSEEAIEGIKKEALARNIQIGAIERVRQQIEALKQAQAVAPAAKLPGINRDLEAYTNELNRLKSVGKAAFEEQVRAASPFVSILERMRRAADLYRRGIQLATNTDNIAKYNRKLQEITGEIDKLSNAGKRGFDALGRPLKEQEGLLQRLQRQVAIYQKGIQEATNTDNIAKYNRKLQESQTELTRVSNIGKAGFDQLGNKIQATGGLLSKLDAGVKSLFLSLGAFFGIQALIAFGKELFDIAKKAEGIEIAFSRIGSADQLEKLRRQTRGTVSDLDLMSAAVKADNFKIPLDVLGKGLAFAQQRAKDTGQEVDYLVNSLVDGIGRKSALKIDNLGISLVDLQKEVKKTGDFATAVGNIMEREMARSGKAVDTLGEKTARSAATWENLKKKVSDVFRILSNPLGFDPEKVTEYTDKLTSAIAGGANKKLASIEDNLIENKLKLLAQANQTLSAKLKGPEFAKLYGAEVRDIKAQIQANANVIGQLNKIKREREEALRISRDQLSVTEMQAKVDSLRKEAADFVIFDKSDKEFIRKKLKEADDLQKKIDDILGKGLKTKEKKEESAYEKAKRQKEKFLEQIKALDAEYSRKSMSKEDAELQAVRDKFMAIRAEVIKFNKENPSLKIDIAPLKAIEKRALEDLQYRQETVLLMTELQKRKELIEKFEQYRDSVGEAAAQERYGKELAAAEEFAVKAKRILGKLNAVDPSSISGAQTEKKTMLNSWSDQEGKAEQARYFKILENLQVYEQKRLVLIENYQRDRAKLEDAGRLAAMAELDKRHKEELGNLDDANAAKLESFKRLFDGVEDLSIKSGRAVVEIAQTKLKELVEQGKISKKYAEEIEKTLKSTGKALDQRLPQQLGNLASQLGNMAGAVGQVDRKFGDMIGTVANVIGGVSNLKSSIDAIKEAQAKGGIDGILGSAAGLTGGFSAIMGVAMGIFNAIDQAEQQRNREREARQEYANERQIKAIDAQTKAMNRQLDLIKDLYGTERLTEYSRALDDLTAKYEKQASDLTGKYILKGDAAEDRIIKLANEGNAYALKLVQSSVGPNKVQSLDVILAKLKDIKTNSTAIEELQALLDNGLLDEVTAKGVQNLIDLSEQYQKTFNAIRAELTGTSISSLTDEIASIFESGKLGVESFAETFEQTMKRAIMNSFKRQFLEKQLQGFYDQFAIAAEDDLTEAEIATLEKLYQDIIAKAEAGFKQLQGIAGVDFGADGKEGAQRGLAGRIKEITADQADLLAGRLLAVQMNGVASLGISKIQFEEIQALNRSMESQLDFGRQILENSLYAIEQREQIIFNTGQTVQRLDATVGELAKQTAMLNDSNNYLRSIDSTSKSQYDGLRANGFA